MNRLARMRRDEGRWTFYLVAVLAFNRLRLTWIRFFLGVDDIYFQGLPRISGRRWISFGKDFRCGRGAWIEAFAPAAEDDDGAISSAAPRILIGDNVNAADNFHIGAAIRVEIGDNALFGSGVLVTDHAHGDYGPHGESPMIHPSDRKLVSKGPVKIGRNTWIGDGVKILSGVTIGDCAVIGANTVVRRDVPANSVLVAGNPNKVVRTFDEATGCWRRVEVNS